MKRKAIELDDRNLGTRAKIEQDGWSYYGIIASIRKQKHEGKVVSVELAFTDGDSMVLDPDVRLDLHITGTELSIMDIHRILQEIQEQRDEQHQGARV